MSDLQAEIEELKADKRMLRALIEEIKRKCENDHRPHGHHPCLLSTSVLELLASRGIGTSVLAAAEGAR